MPVHPKTQAALDAAHAALDEIRHGVRAISDKADQAATIKALDAITEAVADVPIPVAPVETEAASAPPKKKAKVALRARRNR